MNAIPYVCSNSPLEVAIEEKGRVLVLRDALYNPQTDRWHDIRIVRRGWRVFGFDIGGGGRFTGVTEKLARQIQMTYGIVLKTLHARPNEAALWTRGETTSYFVSKNAAQDLATGKPFRGFIRRIFSKDPLRVKTSYPLGKKKDDLFLSKEDAARFGKTKMTLHDAVQKGILEPLGQRKTAVQPTSFSSPPKDEKPLAAKQKKEELSPSGPPPQAVAPKQQSKKQTSSNSKKTSSQGKPFIRLPSIPTYRVWNTPVQRGYDQASFEERKRRIVAHLDRCSPIPFSTFVDHNKERKISDPLFRRMLAALRTLAQDPKSKDPDAKYMKNLLRHWFRAAYHYLDQNSNPGDGYQQILAKISLEVQDEKKAKEKAKELYWRDNATLFWITLIDLFAREKINIESLYKEINKTNLNPLF